MSEYMSDTFDVAILGAGAAGLMLAGSLPTKNKVIIDGNIRPGAKLLATGGGLCNFSNADLSKHNYLSSNPMFCASALAGFTPEDFLTLMKKNHIAYNIRPDGKMFALSAKNILDLLLSRINPGNTRFAYGNLIKTVTKQENCFEITTSTQVFCAKNVVCALGGLSYPKLGATPVAFKIAESFGLEVRKTYPALTGINFNVKMQERFKELAGVSLPAKVSCGKIAFDGDILFTHTGLSGPAIFQLSLYGVKDKEIKINFLPSFDVEELLLAKKAVCQKAGNILAQYIPGRLAKILLASDKQMPDMSKTDIHTIAQSINRFCFTPASITGYDRAEITAGGIDTKNISSKTMQVNDVTGLYFIGEALDVSGQLGGYNLHWAWASATAVSKSINSF